MTKIVTLILAGVVFFNPADVGAQLSNQYYGSDRVVWDSTNANYWYPYVYDVFRLESDQREGFLDELNSKSYGGLDRWRYATFSELISLYLSAGESEPDVGWDVPEYLFGAVNIMTYFDLTNYSSSVSYGCLDGDDTNWSWFSDDSSFKWFDWDSFSFDWQGSWVVSESPIVPLPGGLVLVSIGVFICGLQRRRGIL